MVGQDPEMLQLFLEESNEHLASLETDLLKLEETLDDPDPELVNKIFRAIHSLKGSAGFFGFENITNLSHIMENIFSQIRDGKIEANSSMITTLLDGKDKLDEMIEDVANSEEVDIEDELKRLNAILEGETEEEETVQLGGEKADELPEKISKQFEISKNELKKAIGHGRYLYSVKAFTKKDMKNKGKTPFDYLKGIKKLGNLIASYSDISQIGGLDDSIEENDIAFVFLFSSVLEPDLIALGLEVDEDQVEQLEFPKLEAENEAEKKEAEEEEDSEGEESDVEVKSDEAKTKTINKSKPKPKPKPKSEENNKKTKTNGKPKKKISTKPTESIRVSVPLLNDLMTYAGELVLARNQLLRLTEDVAKDITGLKNVIDDIDMTTSVLQEKIMNTRMQPISIVFNKFPRMIRDLGKKLDKKLNLEISGKDVDLDKSIIEKLSDPLTHIIRNAADHGVESTEKRRELGKPETGTIWLKAYHEGGKVNIDVIDDGKGMDKQRILDKALEKGLISENDVKSLPDKKIFTLIFEPGFSTASQISDVSGRGVGMDVVKTNIEKIGGSVSINSEKGKGTIVNLKLPLTLAIIPSLIVNVQEMNFALPQVSLKELVRIKTDDPQHKIEKVNNAPVMRLRNKLMPLVYLEEVLDLPHSDLENEIVRVLVLQHDENEFGLVVDKIFDSEEIVVKSIPRFFKESTCYAGTTTMSDGSVALILDVAGIATKAKLNFGEIAQKESTIEEQEKGRETEELQNLLLFENAEDEKFALNLDLIKRIEKITTDKVEKVGEKEYIEHEGKSLRIIHLEDYLPVKSKETENDTIYVIIPTQIENPVGIIAHKIIDSIKVKAKIDSESITAKGLIGSSLIKDEIILFPDIYAITEMADPEHAFKYKNKTNKKFKLLLVEDTPFFRSLEKQYLESAGYKVDLANNGMEAMKKLSSNKYDLFVVDIIMPKMDGFEFIKTIKNNPETYETPAVALTTLSDEESRSKALNLGFDAYEVKLHKDHLLDTIKELIGEQKSAKKLDKKTKKSNKK